MRQLYLLFATCVIAMSITAQQAPQYRLEKKRVATIDGTIRGSAQADKLGSLLLHQKLKDPRYAHSTELQHIMVQGDPAAVQALTSKYHGVYKYSVGNVSSVSIAYKDLVAFSASPVVRAIEAKGDIGYGKAFMDTARIMNNIDSAQQGIAPLTMPYKGAGVVVGIIDGGIYFRHKDFRKLNGDTRIRYIWDQVSTAGTAPGPYNYGSQWDSAQINAGTCGHIEPSSDQGHGTAAAGVAAGNGLSWDTGDAYLRGRYVGVAPEANIIVVRVDGTRPDYLATIADAINYIYSKAAALGMPCVINTSVGTYYGPRDGSELSVQTIEGMLTQQSGRVLVAAAGNAGSTKYHLSYPLSATDSLWTWFIYNASIPGIYFDLWADTAQFRNANFALGCDVGATGAVRGRTPYLNALTSFNYGGGTYAEIDDTLRGAGGVYLGAYTIGVTKYEGSYHIEFFAKPGTTSDIWRLETKGQGRFDLWASSSLIGTSNFATLGNPGAWPNYRFSDTISSIVAGWQCSPKVITVANYYNRKGYRNIDSTYINLGVTPGARSTSSSVGPTRDGRIKPDIGATGDVLLTTGDSTYISQLTIAGGANRQKIALGGKHVRDGGTSMASPVVAGAAALYLQEHPTANYAEVMQAFKLTARKDTFTSTVNIPNVRFGWGKLNTYRALITPIVYGCMDTGSANYNPNANVDTGGCIPKVYGCTDTGSINYNPLANVNNGTCIPKVYGCTDTGSINYNASANVNSGTCIPKVYGCTDTGSINYNASANVNNGTCIPKVYGCTDTGSINYNAAANVNNGTCVPKVYGCMDTGSITYNPLANVSNGSCVPKVYGCTDTASINYNAQANVNNGTCVPKVYGCRDTGSINYNPLANVSNGSCIPKVYGCTDTGSINYNAAANVNNGTCVPKVYGCTDTASINYNPQANVSNGSCVPKVYGCTDTGSINYSAQANVSNGSCIPKVYGVMDTTCRNYNPQANVNGGTCIPSGVTDFSNVSLAMDVVPNPFTSATTIFISSSEPLTGAQLRFYDQLGRVVDVVPVATGAHQIEYTNSKLAAGIYDIALVRNESIIAIRKAVVEK